MIHLLMMRHMSTSLSQAIAPSLSTSHFWGQPLMYPHARILSCPLPFYDVATVHKLAISMSPFNFEIIYFGVYITYWVCTAFYIIYQTKLFFMYARNILGCPTMHEPDIASMNVITPPYITAGQDLWHQVANNLQFIWRSYSYQCWMICQPPIKIPLCAWFQCVHIYRSLAKQHYRHILSNVIAG